MKKFHYDLHIHSCLSPCGDGDMTPCNIVGMASLKGLDIVALTDHNTSRNCPAFLEACERQGIVGVAGMELTTSEEIHLLCLFERLDEALAFSDEVERHRFKIKNKPEIFGEQLILNSLDEVIDSEEYLLINATDLDIASAYTLAKSCGAFVAPAHVDKQSNGIIGILGDFPKSPRFRYAEMADLSRKAELFEAYPALADCTLLSSSDAHFLWDINEKENFIELDCKTDSPDEIRKTLFDHLQKES